MRTGVHGAHAVVTCTQCGLTQLNPRPAAAELDAAYPDWLWRDELVRGRTAPSRVDHMLDLLAKYLPVPGTLLDVGCGPGSFLHGAMSRGWQAHGIESSQSQVEYCLAHGKSATFVADFPQMPDDDRRFDVVTFNHVLEHVPSPTTYLRKAFSLLKPGGKVFIAVPNFDSLHARLFGKYWMHLDVPRHLFQFTPQTLDCCIAAAGGNSIHTHAGDHDDNAAGARESLRRWVVYGLLKRPTAAVRADGPDALTTISLPRRIFRAYGNAMAHLCESLGTPDTIVAVAGQSGHEHP